MIGVARGRVAAVAASAGARRFTGAAVSRGVVAVPHALPGQGQREERERSAQLVVARSFHVTPRREITPLIVGLGVAAAAVTIKYGLQAYVSWSEQRASMPQAPKVSTLRRFYDGGFEDEMSRREAALILGVRETASKERIQAAHRKLLMLNHPDTGGSTFLAAKINEAKDMLLKKN